MENLTFIFQGPYYQGITDKCIQTVRDNFPSSQIYFSTWNGQQIPTNLADKFIFQPDPGGEINSIWETSDSTLRQLFSTYKGLVTVTTEWCCKIRSDTCLENYMLAKLIDYLRLNKLNKVIFLNYLSVNPYRFPLAFHFCDWILAGRTCVLKDIFKHKSPKNLGVNHFYGITLDKYQYGWYCKHRSEQYIILNWIKNQKNNIKVPAYQTELNKLIIESHNLFMKDYVMLVPGQAIGVKNMKRPDDLNINANDGLFSSNYYDWECREALVALGLSIRHELLRLLLFSIKRIVMTPVYTIKFSLHIYRHKRNLWK